MSENNYSTDSGCTIMAVVVGVIVMVAILAGMAFMIISAPATSVVDVEKLAASQPQPTPQMIDRETSSAITMTVGELQGMMETLLYNDREMNRKSLETVRDVAIAGDSTQIATTSIMMTPQCIGSLALFLFAVGVIVIVGKAG